MAPAAAPLQVSDPLGARATVAVSGCAVEWPTGGPAAALAQGLLQKTGMTDLREDDS